MKYSLDTSVLIEGWVRTYPIQIFPGLWHNLESLIRQGRAQATEEVLHELEKQEDALTRWAKKQGNLFTKLDDKIQLEVTRILTSHPRLVESGGRRSAADPFVIALASMNACKVVTEEPRTVGSSSVGRVRIPDVCDAMNITCIKLLDLMREQGWRFE
jgi:hypothetical protein